MASMSASTIICTSCWKLVRGCQPSRLGGFARIADEQIDLGGAEELRIDRNVFLPIETDAIEGDFDELTHGMGLAGRDDVIVGLILLKHARHCLKQPASVAPIALGIRLPSDSA